MRILEVAPLWERVPPPAYGGTEAVVGLLTDELAKRGHDVVLRASGDSITLAELRSVYPRSLRTAEGLGSTIPYEITHVADALRDAPAFDIIHNHVGEMLMAFADLVDVPMLTTTHGNLAPDSRFIWQRYRGFYNTISGAQARYITGFPHAHYVGVVHNAIDVQTFPFRAKKEDYLLCLARVSPEKGTHAAKRELYAGARVLLTPIDWEEPFGLVMPEAMACGTPVVAFARGAAPEIVVNGETGFLVRTIDEMVEAVRHVDEIDPWRCREHVERHFDAPVMASGYLAAYERILETARAEHTVEGTRQPTGLTVVK
jgi:glycosyltransferase involved in cell wall biosynthesis